jgi:hypothetical protein
VKQAGSHRLELPPASFAMLEHLQHRAGFPNVSNALQGRVRVELVQKNVRSVLKGVTRKLEQKTAMTARWGSSQVAKEVKHAASAVQGVSLQHWGQLQRRHAVHALLVDILSRKACLKPLHASPVEQGVSLQLWLPRLKKHAKSVPQVPLRWVSHNKNVKDVQQESSLIQWRVRRLTCARVARKDITLKTSAPNFRAKAVLLVGFLKKKGKKSHVMHAQQEHLE